MVEITQSAPSMSRVFRGLVWTALAAGMVAAVPRPGASQVPAAAAAVAANPKDVASADAIVAALYDVISGPAGQKRNWDRFKSLFAPGARLIPTGLTPE